MPQNEILGTPLPEAQQADRSPATNLATPTALLLLLSREYVSKRRHCRNLTPGIERVQAVADISRTALCCRSNETLALIVNPPISAQLEGTPPLPFPQLTSVSVQ